MFNPRGCYLRCLQKVWCSIATGKCTYNINWGRGDGCNPSGFCRGVLSTCHVFEVELFILIADISYYV